MQTLTTRGLSRSLVARLMASLLMLSLFAAACGSDAPTSVESSIVESDDSDDSAAADDGAAADDSAAADQSADDEAAAEEESAADDDGAEEEAAADDVEAEEEELDTSPPEVPAEAGDRTVVRWFVGLGTGSDALIIPDQQAVADEFNAAQDDIFLQVDFVDTDQAYTILNTQVAAGQAPDLVGPVGTRGRDQFGDAWLDLSDLIAANDYDTSDFDPALLDFYAVEGRGQLGVPFGIAPQMMFYNTDLFDEADLNYLPTSYGDPYVMPDGSEVEWSIDTMTEIAKILTVDANGIDATEADFDKEQIIQFGVGNQWTDFRGLNTMFGAGALIDENGDAQMPDQWRDAMTWYANAAHNLGIYPHGGYSDADEFGAGNWFNSGKFGMTAVHTWYMACCIGAAVDDGSTVFDFDWDLAPMPSYNGVATAKLHADTFAIPEASANPDAAFTVMEYLTGDAAADLTEIYGFLPARLSLQDGAIDALDSGKFTGLGLNWNAVVEGLSNNDNPNHELGLPNFAESEECYGRLAGKLFVEPDYDLAASLDQLVADLQNIYDGTGACTLEA